ncbi:GLABROUS1 enhancer-binding protein [Arabidopsis thaliana]|jgi:hypothetical protein|uniref:GLABROUS1 enhancer-binding protein n=4 Tax=Arabidopsis TaxID=3701 RepID=STKLO_ARATH|nr:DNA-binding storekeeper protein-related transcriptional regulator [Arabidopsis thaliana]Q9ASZ1.1 RecName: Full=GLABROUS1 enhancer-binding protein; AltName: Full=Probable transcription factor At4g00270; AltName: Full=Protein GeBP; AltName: Full=Protein STOREKEEPER RELATED 1; AltName: Full=Storekeeper-like protein At4g00270 [Arabidopsis thaliana]KAG7614609.1 GLABROUS1 enhancer-binding protein family [Arabidopsis thaliana x Arabidopsis arenosa]KAG7619105.1 GLABROUS1 enhancer-binding protein fami|eukprot:NP_567163.1 DNA-binding storekeeper protein-related transcriptional regulator [Arabidopsis thaliana]
MVTPKQIDFSSCVGADNSNGTLSHRRSPRNIPSSKRAASVAEEETMKKKMKMKKKKKKLDPPLIVRIWNEEDELSILKGLVDYRAKTGFNPKIDWDAFCSFLGSSIVERFSKDQVLSKIRKLKRRFHVHSEKINQGNDPKFTRSSDSEAFGFSSMIWGQGDDDGMDKEHEVNGNGAAENRTNESGEEMLKEHEEEVANTELLNENGAAKTTENGTSSGKERHDEDNDDDDELCAVQDAFEAVMSQGLSGYQKKLQLEKLMNLGNGKRRELSDEWKALCVEETRFNIKKLRFSAKLAEAANDS